MVLLGNLTKTESDRLWRKLTCAKSIVGAEIEGLEKCPKQTRDMAYGHDILEQYQRLQDELLDLLAFHIPGHGSEQLLAAVGQ